MGDTGSVVGGGRRARAVTVMVVGALMVAAGCVPTSGPVAGEDVTPPAPTHDVPLASSVTPEAECETVATFLFLGGERILVAAGGVSPAERAAIEDAYAEARRAVPPNLIDAVAEVEAVYDRMEAEYLELLADVRDGEPYDRLEVLRVFESRRPELHEVVERTGLAESCERLNPSG